MKFINEYIVLFSLLISVSVIAQEYDSKHLGTLMTDKGKKIELYDYITKGQGELTYHNEKGKLTNTDWKDIEWMKVGDKRYVRHVKKENAKDKNLLELVIQNDKYRLLRMELSGKSFLYIFDMNEHLMEDPITLFKAGAGAHNNNEKASKIVLKYFSSCEDVVKEMENNLKSSVDLFEGLGYTACEGAPDIAPFFKE